MTTLFYVAYNKLEGRADCTGDSVLLAQIYIAKPYMKMRNTFFVE